MPIFHDSKRSTERSEHYNFRKYSLKYLASLNIQSFSKLHKTISRYAHINLDTFHSNLATLENSNHFFFNFQDSHLSELNGAGHHSQYTPNSSSSSTTNSGGTAENPVDLSNSRPPPTNPAAGTAPHDQRNGGALLHDSSKVLKLWNSFESYFSI